MWSWIFDHLLPFQREFLIREPETETQFLCILCVIAYHVVLITVHVRFDSEGLADMDKEGQM